MKDRVVLYRHCLEKTHSELKTPHDFKNVLVLLFPGQVGLSLALAEVKLCHSDKAEWEMGLVGHFTPVSFHTLHVTKDRSRICWHEVD